MSCFRLKFRDEEICLPVLIKRRLPKDDPDPWPWWKLTPDRLIRENEHFEGFFKHEFIKKETFVDLAFLSVLNEMAVHLSPAAQERIQGVIKEAALDVASKAGLDYKI